MMQQGGTVESQIKAVIEAWADAVRRHDLSGIVAHYEPDIVMFDVPPPLQSRGMDEYRKTWDLFFKYHKPSQAFDIEELAITAVCRSAYSHQAAGDRPSELFLG
jgi:ketosteroid isomerase-like protein